MPFIYFSRISEDREELFFAQIPRRKSQGDVASTSIEGSEAPSYHITHNRDESSLAAFKLKYEFLPDRLKSCLDYCSLLTFRYSIPKKDKLVRLLLAEGLVPETSGKNREVVAEMMIEDLIGRGMLRENDWGGLEVVDKYKEVCLVQVDENDFVAQIADSPVRVVVEDDGKDIPPNFKSLQITSLFFITSERIYGTGIKQGLSRAYMETLCRLESLVVLDLHGIIECLPDAVGNLVQLRYLGLFWAKLNELPRTLSNLQKLQTLDLRYCRLRNSHELPAEVLNIKQLRHLLMSHNTNDCGIKVPKGFAAMVDLQTCEGIYAGGGTAKELGNLIQLRQLGVKSVADDHADELVEAIMKMTNLVSLSLEAEGSIFEGTLLPEMEQFSPPPLLQGLNLIGGLVEIPNWVFSMDNLTTLNLSFSRLLENQTSVLQFLPKLKHLTLWNASEAKHIGKGFCDAGGFPKLEILIIASLTLVEWTEIVNGAFPSLRHLIFTSCTRLKFLPEGLQNISTLQKLMLVEHNDIGRRLKGEENYKIKHIPDVLLYFFVGRGRLEVERL